MADEAKPGLIFKQINAVMREIEAIGKERSNKEQGYRFRGIDDVYNELHPLMAKHGVFTVPKVIKREHGEKATRNGGVLRVVILEMEYTFFAEDGSSVVAFVVGEGMDSGDKASNKAMAVAHKYALVQVFAIPTEDEKDPENDSHDLAPSPGAQGAPKRGASRQAGPRPNPTRQAPPSPGSARVQGNERQPQAQTPPPSQEPPPATPPVESTPPVEPPAAAPPTRDELARRGMACYPLWQKHLEKESPFEKLVPNMFNKPMMKDLDIAELAEFVDYIEEKTTPFAEQELMSCIDQLGKDVKWLDEQFIRQTGKPVSAATVEMMMKAVSKYRAAIQERKAKEAQP